MAKSDDGIYFVDCCFVLEAAGGDGWDNKMSSFPGIWYENGTYYLVYEGSGNSNHGAVALATSTDGINFEKQGIIVNYNRNGNDLDGTNTGTPDIFKVDGVWYVTYHSFNWTDCQICVAYGDDLMNLKKMKTIRSFQHQKIKPIRTVVQPGVAISFTTTDGIIWYMKSAPINLMTTQNGTCLCSLD